MKQKAYLFFSLTLIFSLATCSKAPVQNETKRQKPNDVEERLKFHDELQTNLEKEDFTKLEEIGHELTAKKLRFAGGDWKLNRFYENVGSPPGGFNPEKVDWKTRLEKTEKWTLKYPDSIYANIAYGSAQIGYAWQLRGRGFSDTVDQKEFAEFQKWLKRAESTLNKQSDRRKECIAWYRQMQSVCLGLGKSKDEITVLTQEAIAVEPLYWDIYEGYALYLLPRWHGVPGEWEKFAEQSAHQIDGDEGKILYSEICWQMSRFYRADEFFQKNKVSWPAIKSGFILRAKHYGDSLRYLNAFAFMAGSAGDRTTARVLMGRIGDQWEPDFWQEKKYFEAYKKWANESK